MAEQRPSLSKAYTVEFVEENKILQILGVASLGNRSQAIPTELSDIVEIIYPIGTPGFQPGTAEDFFSLEQAACFLSDDGVAAMQLQLRPEAPEVFVLTGNWIFRDSIITVHVKGVGLYGLKVEVNGVFHPDTNGEYLLTGLLSIYIRGISQIETIKLKLCEATEMSLTSKIGTALQEFRQSLDFAKTLPTSSKVLSEASEYINGVPVDTIFDTTIIPNIDGHELPPMEGQLMLSKLERSSEPTVYITLATNDDSMMPGWSAWMTANNRSNQFSGTFDLSTLSPEEVTLPNTIKPVSPIALEAGIEVSVENKQIQISISPAKEFRNLIWQAKNTLDSTDEIGMMVYAEAGTIELEVTDDSLSGTINAQGKAMGDQQRIRTFSAQLFGERQGSAFIKGISSFVGSRPFEGCWQDSNLGVLTLQQSQHRITGSFSKGGYIEGQIVGQIADIRYQSLEGINSHGVLVKTDNNLLVGLTWTENGSKPHAIVAAQVMPQIAVNDHADGDARIPNPQNDAEARELRFLGYDLYSAQKYQEAALILEKVVNYLSHQEKLTSTPFSQANYLVDQGLPLQSLILSANAASDYPRLVSALALAIDLHRKTGKSINEARDSYDFLCIQEHTENMISELDEYSDRMSLLSESFRRGEEILSAGGVGIRFEAESNEVGIKLLRVSPETPASQAGIKAGDVLVAVDMRPIASMTHAQVSELLRGEIGSMVSIRTLRNGEESEMSMIRAPLAATLSNRRHELLQSLVELDHALRQLRDSFLSHIEQLKRELVSVSDIPQIYQSLVARLNQLIETSQRQRIASIASAEKGLAGSLPAISLFQRFVVQMQAVSACGANLDSEITKRLLRLDEEIEAFESDSKINEFDKDFFKLASNTITAFDQIMLSLAGRLRLVEQSAQFIEEGILEPSKTAEVMVGLSRWLDNWREKLATDAAKISSLDNSQSFYNTYISTLTKMGLPEAALQASEAARARAFADLLAGRNQTTGEHGLPTDGFSRSSAPPLSLTEIKQIANTQPGIVIEYFLLSHSETGQTVEDCVTIWVIMPKVNKSEVMIKALQISVALQELAADINRLTDLMAASLETEAKRSEVAELLCKLHSILIEPLEQEELLPNSADTQATITIIPHGNLFSVPFAALLDKEGRYLVEKYALNYATSLSVLNYLRRNHTDGEKKSRRRLLAFVNPDPLPNSEAGSHQQPLSPLSKTAEIFSHISDFYSSPNHREVYEGAIATESILQKRSADADVLYFATHAEVNADDPLSSFIALAKTTEHSGYCRASDASKLSLHRSELVILAACETARGRLSSDGINGLSRAFTQAGASSLLMSLWKVPEERTTVLMVGFHQYWLHHNQTKSVALQNAQKEFLKLKNYRDQPNLWAGFLLFGLN